MTSTTTTATAYEFLPRITLGKVKTMRMFEGEALTAQILCDGKPVAELEDHADGGPVMCHHFGASIEKAHANMDTLRDALGEDNLSHGRPTEDIMNRMIFEHDARKHAKKYFTLVQITDYGWRDIAFLKVGGKKVKANDPMIADWLARNPDAIYIA